MSKKIVISRFGESLEVDTSDNACSKFGFKHGDRIIDNSGYKSTVIGVAVSSITNETLWYARDCDNGRVSYYEPWAGANFSLIPS